MECDVVVAKHGREALDILFDSSRSSMPFNYYFYYFIVIIMVLIMNNRSRGIWKIPSCVDGLPDASFGRLPDYAPHP